MTITVLIADRGPLTRAAVRFYLQAENDIDVVGETTVGDQAVAAAGQLRPQVVLIDLGVPGTAGAATIHRIAQPPDGQCPSVIAMATVNSSEDLFAALRAGAVGYLLKDGDPGLFAQSVRHVRRGHGFIDPQVTRCLIRRFTELSPSPPPAPAPHVLTPREREVLCHLAQGLANRTIAGALDISEGTVKVHVNHILGKLALASRVQATLYAHRHGITTLGTAEQH